MAWAETPAAMTSENLSRLYGRPVEVAQVRLADGSIRRTCLAPGALGP
jgi:hypothetical protein